MKIAVFESKEEKEAWEKVAKAVTEANTEDEAREAAIDWQSYCSEYQNLSYGELMAWQDEFEKLVKKFPNLKEEFEENGIL